MIYTVKSGDTLSQIARNYNISTQELILSNGLMFPNKLLVGQNLFINTPTIYKIKAGDTLYSISKKYDITLEELLKLNPQIINPENIQIDEEINLPKSNKKEIEVNGYLLPNIKTSTLGLTTPFLTYGSVFSYQVQIDGTLKAINDNTILNILNKTKTKPLMVITNISNDGFDSNLVNKILNDIEIQNKLIDNILKILIEKNYYGIDVDFEYILPKDKDAYISFLTNLKSKLKVINKNLSVALAPKYSDDQEGLLYEAHDYRRIGEIADMVILMTYEWGYIYGEPQAVSPYNELEKVLTYATSRINSNKILMGIPNYAYDWKIPYKPSTSARTLTNTQAINLAINKSVEIKFDNISKTPYFNYMENNQNHIVWFDDAKSLDAKFSLAKKYNLLGISFWTINNFYPVNWSVLNYCFDIKK